MGNDRRQFLKHLACLTGIAGSAGLPALASASTRANVDNIRLSNKDGYIRLVFDLNESVKHSIFSLHTPERVVLDMKNASMPRGLIDQIQANSLITGIRSGIRNGNDLRVVFDLQENITPRSFLLTPSGDAGHRLVLDLHRDSRQSKIHNKKKLRDVIIAIDAGHGGKDPGATGASGTHEKTITLQIAKKLEKIVNQKPGMKAVLIRSNDRFMRLRERIAKARDSKADMMISLHADSFPDPRAKGSSVYALSVDGATSETARLLADNENATDLLFGDVSMSVDDQMVKEVLFDLSLTGTIQASLDIGSDVLSHIRKVNRVHKKSVQQAGFAVLKAPNIPSILLETAFISNPREERNLRSSAHQMKVAKAIGRGVSDYFSSKAPPGTWLSVATDNHQVRTGDTLVGIAEQYNTSVKNLRSRNALHTNSLSEGQLIKIQVS